MLLSASATAAGTLLDASMEVAANASLGTGPRACSLGLLADGHLATGTAFDGMQLFADTTMTRALLDSLTEVAANASLTIDSAASSLQLPADGHLAVGMQSCGVRIFPSATLACARPDTLACARLWPAACKSFRARLALDFATCTKPRTTWTRQSRAATART